ncbi:MAG: class I SAM-dependent methyltransferase [Rhodobacterales bacterium]|nr:class I SAM-dependent methyltransferase [Rhodobacterales bacterium]
MLLAKLLDHLIRVGTLVLIDADGASHRFSGTDPGPEVTVRLHDKRLYRRLFYGPELRAGEAYMDGTLTVEDGSIFDFLNLVARNYEAAQGYHPVADKARRLDTLFRHIQQFNPARFSRRNVAHHYDLSGELYELFLDQDRQYSCAYFPTGEEDLETAQDLKKRHIAAKLQLEPGQSVLDIGSGWGGMGLYLARTFGVKVTGVTLSEEQLKVSRARAAAEGLDDRVRFELVDYRALGGRYDRIVSVGMFEHVGVGHFRDYFGQVRDLLTDDGVALLHTIGRMEPPGSTSPWIRKYIFPGGYIPALSETVAAIERSTLWVTDVEILRMHYAHTLSRWRDRFQENRDKVKALYDETFCRMWEFYLAASEVSFRNMGNTVFQIQIARRQDAVPLTRDYIGQVERDLAGDSAAPRAVRESQSA